MRAVKQKSRCSRPTFSVRVEKQVVSISAFKAGLWEGSFNAPKTLVYLPSAKKKARFETQFAIKDARLQSIINSFGGAPDGAWCRAMRLAGRR